MATLSIEGWERPHFIPSPLPEHASPFAAIFIFGTFSNEQSLSSSTYRCDGVAFDAQVYNREDETGKDFIQTLTQSTTFGFAQQLEKSFSAELVDLTRNAPQVMLIKGNLPEQKDLSYLRNLIGFIMFFIRQRRRIIAGPAIQVVVCREVES